MDILIHCTAETGGTTLQKSGRAKKYLNEISQKSGIGNGKRLQSKMRGRNISWFPIKEGRRFCPRGEIWKIGDRHDGLSKG